MPGRYTLMELISQDQPAATLEALVVDDARTIRFAMARMLGELGINVTEASSGEEALASFRLRRPDLVLIDVNMPGMSDFHVVKEMRAIFASHFSLKTQHSAIGFVSRARRAEIAPSSHERATRRLAPKCRCALRWQQF